MKCKFCGVLECVKNGKVKGQQRYYCKSCFKNFTDTPHRGVGEEKRLLAVSLYASGLSMNRIAQFFDVSCTAVLKWVRAFSEKLCPKIEPDPSQQVLVLEVDEFWHYLKKRVKESGSLKPMIAMVNDLSTGSLEIVMLKPSNSSMSD